MSAILTWLKAKIPGSRRAKGHQALEALKIRHHAYRAILAGLAEAQRLMDELQDRLASGGLSQAQAADTVEDLEQACFELVDGLNFLTGGTRQELFDTQRTLAQRAREAVEALAPGEPIRPGVVFLRDLTPELRPLAGAKAGSLAVLIQAGLPVPDGFAVTQPACRDFLRACGAMAKLRGWLIGRLGSAQDDWPGLEELARETGEAIAKYPLPSDLAEAMAKAQQTLFQRGATALAVRSSAAGEDQLEHSFAGQYHTVLNVIDRQGLEQAFREVLGAAFSARALAYKLQTGLAMAEPDMAVFCQEMVPAKSAGVLFTVDPAYPDSGRMMISAVPGLGTLAVGGEAPADLYLVSRDDFSDVQAQIAEKTDREVCAPTGGLTRESLTPEERGKPLLDSGVLAELSAAAMAAEAMTGQPQDVEWALTQQRSAVILQSRPLRLSVRGRARPAKTGDPPRQEPRDIPADESPAMARLRRAVLPQCSGQGKPLVWSAKDCLGLGDLAVYVRQEAAKAVLQGQDELSDQVLGLAPELTIRPGLVLSLVDLGGALNHGQGAKLRPEDLSNPGFKALCLSLASQAHEIKGQALALASSDYLSLRLRMGRQSVWVEAVCSFDPRENFLALRLDVQAVSALGEWGLGAFLTEALQAKKFATHAGVGVFQAWLDHIDQPEARRNMDMLGRLLAFLGENTSDLELGQAPGQLAKAFLDDSGHP